MTTIKEPFNVLACTCFGTVCLAWLAGAILCALLSETFDRLFHR